MGEANSRKGWRLRPRFSWAVGLALSAHAALLSYVPAPRSNPSANAGAMFELDLLPDEPLPDEPLPTGSSRPDPGLPGGAVTTESGRESPATARTVPEASRTPSSTEAAPPEELEVALPSETAPGVTDANAAARTATPSGERKAIRLFLGPKDLAELSRRRASAPSAPPREAPSVGRIAEEAEARDASLGLSRSSAAVSVCYRSAQFAPEVGTAVLEVRTDARGAVTSVNVVGNAVTDAWVMVADDLLSRLKERLLRVPAGARGLITRLRIDRGYLAEDLSERGRVQRGVAIGQDHHEKDYSWDESTQASIGGHRPAASLGASSDWLRKRVKTRVSIVSQHTF